MRKVSDLRSYAIFVIRAVASFEVVPIWLNHTLPAVRPHLKAVLERRFWNGFQLALCITLNRLDVVEPLSFERHFKFWEHPKVAGIYCRDCTEAGEAVQSCVSPKFATQVSMKALARYRVEEASHCTPAKILFQISQTVVFGIPKSFSSSRTVNRRSSSIVCRSRSMFSGVVVSEGRPERGSLSTDVRQFLNRLYHSFICVMSILSSTMTFCIILIVSVQLLPRLKQNLMQIRWSVLSAIFNWKQMRRTEKARWT